MKSIVSGPNRVSIDEGAYGSRHYDVPCHVVSEILQMEARVAELEAERKWHLVPDANFNVLVCWDATDDYPVIGMLDGGKEGQWVDHNGDPFPIPPSHWMPLPDPVNP